ncbi:MFS general substrate transporter [Xylariaceae sp. FL0662B]|nr:MFS general substrate transporter [Xylariaceae sp. FL0662B]
MAPQYPTNPNDGPANNETTPLLANSPVAPAGEPEVARAVADDNAQPKHADKPLPKLQIFLLCYARLIEPIAFFSIFPYINQMVQENGNLDDADVGFYSGLIESLFSLTQMVVMLFWGWASDRVGRKPVLVFSLFGVSIATAVFGLARTVAQMVAFRCLAGVFAGTIVTIRTMVAEHSGPRTQARAFSWFAFSGNLGIFLGPLLGGALADPARQFPGAFARVAFFRDYPYALASAVVGCLGLTAAVSSALFVEETLHRTRGPHHSSSSNGEAGNTTAAAKPGPKSTLALLAAPGVGVVLYNYGHAMLLGFAYTAIVPVFWYTPVALGGFAFTPLQISLLMGLTGLSQAVWLLLVFPPLQRRLGTNGVLRACGTAYPLFMAVMPVLSLLLRADYRAAFWTAVPLCLVVGPGVSMAFTAVQLALNDVSPGPESLGMLNALALTLVSALRSFSPALFASLFAVSARSGVLGGYVVWIVMVVLAFGFTVSTRFLPEASENDAAGSAQEESEREQGPEEDETDTDDTTIRS